MTLRQRRTAPSPRTLRALHSALGRLGDGPIQRGRWLLHLANVDLKGLPERAKEALTWEVCAFGLGERAPEAYTGPATGLSESAVKQWQKDVQNGLAQMQRRGWTLTPSGTTWRARLDRDGVRLEPLPPGGFKVSVLNALKGAGHRLRVCPGKGCGLFFVKTGRRKYCKPQCATRARVQKHRAKKTFSTSSE
jgi:CGNR zinc finger